MGLKPIDFYDANDWKLQEVRDIEHREHKAIKTILKEVAASDKKTLKILDVGCGDGQFLDELAKQLEPTGKKIKFYGADYSKYKLKNAKKLHPKFEFVFCNLEENIPYKDDTFDFVYSGEVIEHIYNPDYMLEECWRVLKTGGHLVLSTPNLQTWYNRFFFLFGIQPLFYETSTKSAQVGGGILRKFKQETPVGHIRVFNRTSITDLLKQEGFELVSFQGAIFHALPKPMQLIDKTLASIRPSLSSNMIVTSRKVAKESE